MVDGGNEAHRGESLDAATGLARLLAAAGASRPTEVAGFPVPRGIRLLHGGEWRIGEGMSVLDAATSADGVDTLPPWSRSATIGYRIDLAGDEPGRHSRRVVERPSEPSAPG